MEHRDSDGILQDPRPVCQGKLRRSLQTGEKLVGDGPRSSESGASRARGQKFTQTSSCLRRTTDDVLGVQSEAYFMKFFSDNMLPSWGKRDTWIQRVYRFKEEREEGGDITRWAINQDTLGLVQRTRNGIETYRFEANLHRTSVAILKTKLLVIGMFPSDNTLDLYFGADRHNALEDDKPLSFYEGQNFRDMWLEVRKVDHEDEISTTDLGCELALTYQPRDPKRSMRSIKDKSRAYAPDPSLKRTLEIMEGSAVPTITERMERIGQLASRLMQATEAGGGRDILHPHLKGRKSTSGAEILDNLEDLEELEELEERRQTLKRALRFGNANQMPSEELDERIPRGMRRASWRTRINVLILTARKIDGMVTRLLESGRS